MNINNSIVGDEQNLGFDDYWNALTSGFNYLQADVTDLDNYLPHNFSPHGKGLSIQSTAFGEVSIEIIWWKKSKFNEVLNKSTIFDEPYVYIAGNLNLSRLSSKQITDLANGWKEFGKNMNVKNIKKIIPDVTVAGFDVIGHKGFITPNSYEGPTTAKSIQYKNLSHSVAIAQDKSSSALYLGGSAKGYDINFSTGYTKNLGPISGAAEKFKDIFK